MQQRPLNVLLITFSFPPVGGVGVFRALSLAKYLPSFDLRVDVLTAANAPAVGRDAALLAQVPAEVTVHRAVTLDLPFGVRKFVKKLVSGRGGAAAPKPADGGAAPSARKSSPLSVIKGAVANLLLPDPQIGWLPFAFPAARRIIRKRKIDAVLITVPPFSTSKLVTKLRREFPSLPIVLDFRDEWLQSTIHLVSFNNNERATRIATETEREAVRDATTVVMVTEAARDALRSRYPEQSPEKFVCIFNGYDTPPPTPQPARTLPASGPVTLTYIGTVYGSTDPLSFVKAVLRLPPAQRERLRIRFIGRIETEAYRQILQELGPTVSLEGFVPQSEALAAVRDADYLLLITHDPINVSAKFYDYLGAGRPILAAVHPQGDVRRLLERTGAGAWADVNSVDAIYDLLVSALDSSAIPVFQPKYEVIAGFHRRALAGEYAALLRRLSAGERSSS